MTFIRKAGKEDVFLLADIGKLSFLASHGNSAPVADIDSYVNKTYTADAFISELSDERNIYHLIHCNGQTAGYSKIIFTAPHPNIPLQKVTKLERLYLLKEFYDLKLGFHLLNFIIALSKQNMEAGMWLYVWKENQRAVRFYTKSGFSIIGSYDFRISETHTNPNHLMLLNY